MPLLLLFVALLCIGPTQAQSIQEARISRGDDPRWADPAFDDREWQAVGSRQVRVLEEAKRNRLWLRMRVTIPAEPSAVLVYFCPCEIFLNGVRLGATGDLDAARPLAIRDLRTFAIPASLPAGPALLAVRQYQPPGIEAALPFWFNQAIRIAPVRTLGEAAEEVRTNQRLIWGQFLLLLLSLGGVMTAAAGARRDPLVIAMLLYVLSILWGNIMLLAPGISHASGLTWNWTVAPLVVHPALVFMQFLLARIPISWKAVVACYAMLVLPFRLPWIAGLYLATPQSWTPFAVAGYVVPHIVGLGFMSYAAYRGWRGAEGRRMLLLITIASLALNLAARLTSNGMLPAYWRGSAIGSLGDTAGSAAFLILSTSHIIRDTRRRRAEEQRLQSELESAQMVQSLLLTRDLPRGVEAVYLPAAEVGGDFYHVAEHPDGSLVVLVGDVSGKGLRAAMLVSVAIGILRRERSTSPGAILSALNDGLAGHLGGGFVTCCCARFAPDGSVSAASAGHPAPYADGGEAADLEAQLPLGMAAGNEYHEQLLAGERFVFLSDGVVEAANAKGELFGFDRTREISTKSASEIAEAAKAWGQNDDITVVTVRRTTA